MAKKKSEKGSKPHLSGGANDPLHGAIATFERGDYARAKLALAAASADSSLAEGQREQARELVDATKIERGTLWVGVACVGLLALVIVVTVLTQP